MVSLNSQTAAYEFVNRLNPFLTLVTPMLCTPLKEHNLFKIMPYCAKVECNRDPFLAINHCWVQDSNPYPYKLGKKC